MLRELGQADRARRGPGGALRRAHVVRLYVPDAVQRERAPERRPSNSVLKRAREWCTARHRQGFGRRDQLSAEASAKAGADPGPPQASSLAVPGLQRSAGELLRFTPKHWPRCATRGTRIIHVAAILLLVIAASVLVHVPTAQAQGARSWQIEDNGARHVVIPVNKSKTFRLDQPFSTAVVGSPDIADALPMSDRSLYVQGKKIGTTNVSVFDTSMRLLGVLDVEVSVDTGDVQQKINAATGSRGIRVSSSDGQAVLSGEAQNAVEAERAVAIARSLAPNGVVNAMQVAPSQQVLLKVSFYEATRDANRALGLNWFVGNRNGNSVFTSGTGLQVQSTPPTSTIVNGNATITQNNLTTTTGIPLFLPALAGQTPFGIALANLVNGGTRVDVLVQALETKGLLRRLAEPTLMALSGDTASFLAGGEIPVPIAAVSQAGAVTPTIEYKPFGVRLTFTPVVLQKGKINLRLQPEVSDLDPATGVTISGTTVPGLVKRTADTTIELRDGQSFAIAGLLQANDSRARDQLPWLGSVPVLGALFSSNEYRKHETDLVIIVTPHLVQPAAPGDRLATPLDQRLPSNDIDFFLLGQSEVKKAYSDYVTTGGDVQGPYGHMLRVEPAAPDPVFKR
jgi:pilus assembly protein CpaC